MIEFKFNCPSCGQHIQATDAYSGRQINCPACHNLLTVPLAPGAPPPMPAMAAPISPAARSQAPAPAAKRPLPPAKKSNLKWILIGSGAALAVVAAVAVVLFMFVFHRSEESVTIAPEKKPGLRAGSGSANLSGPSASEIVQKVTDKYASLTSYSAQGSAVIVMDMSKVDMSKMPGMDKVPKNQKDSKQMKETLSKPIRSSSEFSVKLGRPDLYRVDWDSSSQGAAMKGGVWSSGEGNFISLTKTKYTKMDTRELALASATGVSGGVAGTMPAIFFNDATSTMSFFTQADRAADEAIDGEDCFVLNGDTMGIKVVLWISKDTFLIKQRQMVFGGKTKMPKATDAQIDEGLSKMNNMTAEQKKQAKTMAKQMQPMLSQMKGNMTETYRNIEINKPLDKKDFKYDLPPGAQLSKTMF